MYTVPTADDFRTKFPELDYLSDEEIEASIAEATRSVDETWTEGDYGNAILYLAAHYSQAAANAATSPDGGGSGPITAEHIGPISVSYGSTKSSSSSTSSTSSLSSTYYGQCYLDLLKKNIPAILVV